jgi:hypothetical protein
VFHPLSVESEVVNLDCRLAQDHAHGAHDESFVMDVLDLNVEHDGGLPPMQITRVQPDREYNWMNTHLPNTLYFMFVAELTVTCVSQYPASHRVKDAVFKYKVLWSDPIKDASPDHPKIVDAYQKFVTQRGRDYSPPFRRYEIRQSVQVHQCASIRRETEVTQPHLTV